MDLMDQIRRPLVNGVKLVLPSGRGTLEGSMCVTAFFLIYSTRRHETADEITVLHSATDHVEYKPGSSSVVVALKDFRRLNFEFSSVEECQDMVHALELLPRRQERIPQLYAFSYVPRKSEGTCKWHFPTAGELFAQWQCEEERWRVSRVNEGFQVCPSYPQEAIVPKSISDADLYKVSKFRHMSRFPVICFHHRKNQAVLVRCGQPLCGPGQKKCKEDVALLNACLPRLSRGKILDIRPLSVAHSHMSKGGGIELPFGYPHWKVEYGDMESIASIQASMIKLIQACSDPSLGSSSSWFARLDQSGWLNHIARLLSAAKFVSLCIHKEANSVVVHGASGRDTTLQVTALSQVLLDPDCRTAKGFVGLIQREWLDGGHPFSLRHSHVSSVPENDRSPTFLVFIDAVWQVMQQYPLSFEFNERFLHTLFVHSYYSEYGNFLYDTPQERQKNRLSQRTKSLWDHLSNAKVLGPMLNPLYERNSSVLLISVHALSVTLWKALYLRSDTAPSLSLPSHAAEFLLKEHNTALKEALTRVQRDLLALQVEGRKYTSNWS